MRSLLPCLLGLLLATLLGMTRTRADESDRGFSEATKIEKRISTARAELAALTPEADSELRGHLQRLVAAGEYHLSSIGMLAAMRGELARATEESASWNGFASPPPYPVRLHDEIRQSQATCETTESISIAQIRIFKRETESLVELRGTHLQTERRFLEEAAAQSTQELRAQNLHSAKVENLQARVLAEMIGRRQVGVAIEESHLAAATARKELARRKLKEIGDQVLFTRDELDRILEQIARARDQAANALIVEISSSHAPDPLLAWKLEFLDLQMIFWENRFSAMERGSGTNSRKAITTIKSLRDRIDAWVKVADLRLAGGDMEIANFDPVKLRDSVLELRAMQRRIAFALDDLAGFDLRNRGTPLLDRVIDVLQSIWNAELYLVEESEIVDGKKIPAFLAITVGKVLRLTLILVAGWVLLRWLSRRIQVRISQRATIAPTTAELIGKWAFGVGICLLVLYALHAVRIPLTAFAFLGGALAIGVGFGTQTILKNFISGMIIMFERPLKVGDVVEVSNITGTIRKIGMRASVIQHFDGIDTLVPNSILLENQLTNWTFSSTVIRHQVVVGVAYGSPTREVSRVLLAVAASHGLVKKDPPPEVRFDDFGANSLQFTLLFWLDTRKIARNQLASDLRYMIDKALAESGITIAFPQRDIHFDPKVPLRVEFASLPNSKPDYKRQETSSTHPQPEPCLPSAKAAP